MAKSAVHHQDHLIIGIIVLAGGMVFYPTTCCMYEPQHPGVTLGQLMFVSYVWIGTGMIAYHGYKLVSRHYRMWRQIFQKYS